MKDHPNTRRIQILICIALLVITLITFWRVFDCKFVRLDDKAFVVDNTHIQTGINLENVKWALTTGYESMWQPLTWFSYMVDYHIYGLDPFGFHLTNLLFHIANVLLLFLLLTRMTGSVWRSAFVAAIFAIHPLRVESVAWVAERKDVLSGFFWLSTMWAYFWYTQKSGIKRYLLVTVLYLFGLMSKPMLVTLPFVLLLMDYWPLCRLKLDKIHNKTKFQTIYKLTLEKIPLILMAIICSIITLLVQVKGGALHLVTTSPGERIANALNSYIVYLEKLFWPNNLAVLYPHPQNTLSILQVIISGLLLAALTILILRSTKRVPYLTTGWLWYLITLFPVVGVLQTGVQASADRYTYIPMLGISILIVWGVSDFTHKIKPSSSKYLAAAGIIILIAFATTTWAQVGYWKNTVTLYEHTLNVTQNNFFIQFSFANDYQENGDVDNALYHYEKAIEINPNYTIALINMGVIRLSQGENQEAIELMNKVIKLSPKDASAYINKGLAYDNMGNYDKAIESYNKAIELNQQSSVAHYNLAVVLYEKKKYKEAWKTSPYCPQISRRNQSKAYRMALSKDAGTNL